MFKVLSLSVLQLTFCDKSHLKWTWEWDVTEWPPETELIDLQRVQVIESLSRTKFDKNYIKYLHNLNIFNILQALHAQNLVKNHIAERKKFGTEGVLDWKPQRNPPGSATAVVWICCSSWTRDYISHSITRRPVLDFSHSSSLPGIPNVIFYCNVTWWTIIMTQ